MKNQIKTLQKENSSELRAKKAIHEIYRKIEARYPSLSDAAKTKLIIECLIEINEEKKHTAKFILQESSYPCISTKQAS